MNKTLIYLNQKETEEVSPHPTLPHLISCSVRKSILKNWYISMSLQKPSRNYIHQPILSHTYTQYKTWEGFHLYTNTQPHSYIYLSKLHFKPYIWRRLFQGVFFQIKICNFFFFFYYGFFNIAFTNPLWTLLPFTIKSNRVT